MTLEHVLPQRIDESWGVFDEEMHLSSVRRIGNLAILAAEENIDIANKPFGEKRKAFKRSSFVTTKSIAKKSDWTQDTIAERQVELAQLAVKTWPISGDVRKRRVTTDTANRKTKTGTKKGKRPAKKKSASGRK